MNDQPVADAAAFGRLSESADEILLSVKDRVRPRAIKIAASAR